MNGRDFTDEKFNEAWNKIVEKKGSPVPILVDESGRPKTREQLTAYAMNCRKFLEYAESLQSDPEKNNDSYWTAATHWWKTRIECLTAAARRAKPCPPPPLLPLKRPFSLDPTSSKTAPPTKICRTETDYQGEAWDTTPRSTEATPTSPRSPESTYMEKSPTRKSPTEQQPGTPPLSTNLFATLMTEAAFPPMGALEDLEANYKNL